ncbi:fumarate hydratase [Carboxydothermus hydrogenoformans]|uniref:Fumarate hydratase, alpha subunit n=1 Tax=Carboxydothermus hydrogenoformans (strain ATCC BAA-161 / DSM 6008 / Z-2901) TaxID=246194 RepID=Q3ACC7_CARHZ|nr:fumarate hydratase [Carboxydothermus hydrogenoformans]ABB13917.1 fumarate hydratase, alpha subunit [Carboxydothermus hydrogenoformans Z-2901]
MRNLDVKEIKNAVKTLVVKANQELSTDILNALKVAANNEESEVGKKILQRVIENAQIAKDEELPICQDTGTAVIFLEIGQDVHLVGGDLHDAINQGVREGYSEGYLRKSIVKDPLNRVNTGDNTPAVVHIDIVPGDRVKITVAPKGGGSENMSQLKMLKPADGVEGVKQFVIDTVRQAGSNPCPPIIVGVGIGGTFEKAALLAKKALLREVGTQNPDPFYNSLERELLEKINNLGIGPQGLGGRVTALAVHIETYPTHIASLPVAVNLNCHVARHETVIL